MKNLLLVLMVSSILACTVKRHHIQTWVPDDLSLELERRTMELSEFKYYKRISELPPSVSTFLKEIAKGKVAESDEMFNDSDSIVIGLPFLQHVISASSDNFYFIILRAGGFSPTSRLYIYESGANQYCSYVVGWYGADIRKIISDLNFGKKEPRKRLAVCQWHQKQSANKRFNFDGFFAAMPLKNRKLS